MLARATTSVCSAAAQLWSFSNSKPISSKQWPHPQENTRKTIMSQCTKPTTRIYLAAFPPGALCLVTTRLGVMRRDSSWRSRLSLILAHRWGTAAERKTIVVVYDIVRFERNVGCIAAERMRMSVPFLFLRGKCHGDCFGFVEWNCLERKIRVLLFCVDLPF